ncbi:MAG: cysteine hydrolase [Clostridia bacterium]|nr:cysteine hydrolase [Clostridia bacterium]
MKVLCVIDMQNDFIDGALGTKEAEAIVENVKAKIELYRKNGDTVIFTRDTHSEDYMNTQEGKNLPVPHCIKGSKGWEVSEKLDTASYKIIDKPTFGSFELAEYISTLADVDEIELIGLCTDICVISNAMILKARFTETPIKVDSSCCAGVTPESHTNALGAMKMCQINCF